MEAVTDSSATSVFWRGVLFCWRCVRALLGVAQASRFVAAAAAAQVRTSGTGPSRGRCVTRVAGWEGAPGLADGAMSFVSTAFFGCVGLADAITMLTKATKKPKKPLSAYTLYMKDQLSSDKIYSEIPFTERAKLVGQRWKALDENAKAPYAAEAARLKAEFV